jgi:hypothetical protein
MAKKSSNMGGTTNRGHRHPKSAGRPPGRGFTGHRGRGNGRDFIGGKDVGGIEERPESAVDDVDEDEDDSGSSEGRQLSLSVAKR